MSEPDSSSVHWAVALLCYFGMLAGAMLTLGHNPEVWRHAWLFPLGFTPFLPFLQGVGRGLPLLVVGVVIHALFLLLFLSLRRRPLFFAVVLVYALLLMLNVEGCRQMTRLGR